MAIKPATDLVKQFAHTLPTGPDDIDYAFRTRQIIIPIPTDVAGQSYSIPLEALGVDVLLTSVSILPGAALAAHDSNYKTLAVKTGNQAGGALSTAIAQVDTRTAPSGGTGNWAARTAISIFSGRSTIAAASTLYLEIAASGMGVALTGANIVVTYQVL